MLEAPFPPMVRELAEKTVDQTREAYERCSGTLEASVRTVEKSLDEAGHCAVALNRKIIDIAQRNLDSGFDLAKGLSGARNLSEIMKLQAAYWWKQFDALISQAGEVRDRLLGIGVAKAKTAQPSHPIEREPAKKAAEKTPKKRPSHAAQDEAAERLKQKPDTQEREAAPPAAPKVHLRDESQPLTAKMGTPQAKPKGRQRPTARDPATPGEKRERKASRTTLKTRSTSRPVARPNVPPAEERQRREEKNATAEDQPVLPRLAAEIKFGVLDGNAVRFTELEAWWLVDGAWRPIPPGEILSNAAVIKESRFNKLFPQAPRLPSEAFQADHRQD